MKSRVNKIDSEKLEQQFLRIFTKMSTKEISEYMKYFSEKVQPFLLYTLYSQYDLRSSDYEKRRRFLEYFFMLGIVYPHQPYTKLIFKEALKYAKAPHDESQRYIN